MQRKAFKQFNKVTQWTNEKVFSSTEKTKFSDEFEEFEAELEPLCIGVERLHTTSNAFYEDSIKLRANPDPYPSGENGKEKLRLSEALGLVMMDYGNDAGGTLGDGLIKYGQARCKLAEYQDEFSGQLYEHYVMATDKALNCVNEYRTYRKKMDSRRLTLDASLTRQRTSKKDSTSLDQEVELAQERLDEAADETKLRMQAIKEEQEAQYHALAALLDAELAYFSRCKGVLEDLLSEFPTSYEASVSSSSAPASGSKSVTRPRAKSSASATGRSATPRRKDSSDGDMPPPSTTPKKEKDRPDMNRARSDSASKRRGSIMSSLGNIGNKGLKGGKAAASVASSAASKTASYRPTLFGRGEKKYANMDEEERRGVSLASSDEETRYDPPPPAAGGRQRSHSVAAEILTTSSSYGRRRALTSPSTPGSFVKVLFDFEGLEADELPLKRGQIVEVKSEVSSDWLIGECEGMTGLFPRAFTEEYIPERPALPARPGSFNHMRSNTHLGVPSSHSNSPHSISDGGESDASDAGFDALDDAQSTSLASAPAPTPTSRSRAGSTARKAPPPPPSRRQAMSPPAPPLPRSRSSTLSRPQQEPIGASPFSDQ